MKESCIKFNYFLYFCYGITLSGLLLTAALVHKGDDVLWINGNHSLLLNGLFYSITNLGDGLIFVPITIVLLFVRFQYALVSATAGVLHGIICSVLKHQFFSATPRPAAIISHDLLYFIPGVDVHSHHSFPSGHTATIFCAVFLLSLIFQHRLLSISLLIIALLVGYSRIYLLQHFLIDVVGGALVGTITTFILWTVFEKNNRNWMNSRIELQVRQPQVQQQ
jgi:membrane-associated phospholipid phosphatase